LEKVRRASLKWSS